MVYDLYFCPCLSEPYHSYVRALSRDFFIKQQYEEKMSTCSTLISHLQRLQSPADAPEEDQAVSQASATPPLERAPVRTESAPAAGSPGGGYLLRRDRDEMLIVPSASSLTRRRSKKEKRRSTPVVKVRRLRWGRSMSCWRGISRAGDSDCVNW